jgi:hypothetical protein
MHYKNGREAKNGDKVVLIPSYGAPTIGILYDAVAGNDTCNGRLAAPSTSDPMPNLAECLHLDDVKAVLEEALADYFEKRRKAELPASVPDTSKPAAPASETTEASGS